MTTDISTTVAETNNNTVGRLKIEYEVYSNIFLHVNFQILTIFIIIDEFSIHNTIIFLKEKHSCKYYDSVIGFKNNSASL